FCFSKCQIAVIECAFSSSSVVLSSSLVLIKLPSSASSKFKILCFCLSNPPYLNIRFRFNSLSKSFTISWVFSSSVKKSDDLTEYFDVALIAVRSFGLFVKDIVFRHVLTTHIQCMDFFKFSFNRLHQITLHSCNGFMLL